MSTTRTEPPASLLDRVRKLLAKAEAAGVTPHEAEALTAKAAELMARHGIDRALLAATQPETDKPADRLINIDNPWATIKIYLLNGVASALRCQCVQLGRDSGVRAHIFGYSSDLERVDILYTSLLVQMAHGVASAIVPGNARSVRAWRRSWMLGYAAAVTSRIRIAEETAAKGAEPDNRQGGSTSVAVVLADRSVTIERKMRQTYPHTRSTRMTYSGNGYSAGFQKGQAADIGRGRVGSQSRQLSR